MPESFTSPAEVHKHFLAAQLAEAMIAYLENPTESGSRVLKEQLKANKNMIVRAFLDATPVGNVAFQQPPVSVLIARCDAGNVAAYCDLFSFILEQADPQEVSRLQAYLFREPSDTQSQTLSIWAAQHFLPSVGSGSLAAQQSGSSNGADHKMQHNHNPYLLVYH